MSQTVILHLFGWDKKFFIPFRAFIQAHFADGSHQFIVYGAVKGLDFQDASDTVAYPSLLKNAFALSKAMYRADKIILHGLFSNHLLYLLTIQPWLLKKCHWCIWGGDLYVHETPRKDWRWKKNEWFRRFVIKRIGHFVSQIKGDYELAQQWYGANGQWHECFMYPSNLYKDYAVPPKQGDFVNILVGNSADPTNNHAEIFEKLMSYKDQNIQIVCPLSYGSAEYANQMTKLGKELFGDRFTPLLDFLSFDKYLELLGQIDIAVFAHKRQQGMGNTISLLGLGKKVFLRGDVTAWKFFQELGVKVFDSRYFNLLSLDVDERMHNQKIIAAHFSQAMLIQQWRDIFKG